MQNGPSVKVDCLGALDSGVLANSVLLLLMAYINHSARTRKLNPNSIK